MVAFYLQYTKKVVNSIFLIAILTSLNCSNLPVKDSVNNCREIKNYLEMELRLSSDTIKYGESLEINVLFRNKTDTDLQFYPKALLYIAQPSIGFETSTYPINDTLYITEIADIGSRGTKSYTYNIKINRSFFNNGKNLIRLIYLCSELKGDHRIYNKLCGSLESQEVNIFVKD